jgi:tetratricopeptide (TPR) repeat protein
VRGGARATLVVCAASLLATACGTPPVAPVPEGERAVRPQDLAAIVERRRQQALRLQQSGDLAGVAAEWQVLTLLEPRNETFARELANARGAIARVSTEQLQAGNAALRRGDLDAAYDAMLRVLAVSQENAEAANALREIERRRAVRTQTDRVTRLRPEDYGVPGGRAATGRAPAVAVAAINGGAPEPRGDANRAYDFDQSMELFRAGDVRNGLAGFRRYVEANPNDRAGRQEIGNAVSERAKVLDGQGQPDQAIALYEQAASLSGNRAGPWSASLAALRKKLGAEQYDQGMRLYRTDLAGAIRHFQAAVGYDPANTAAQAKLQEAKVLQDKLKRIDGTGAR